VVLTGTPAGVGELPRGAELRLALSGGLRITTRVID
jgi:2-keto-4-pentenoate hydratase/2-oxohepta-3-ene-1,7-dioic acid hydratase in catechol pathway